MANTEAKPKKLYAAGDITEISGLDRNKIYYWSKTLGVIIAEHEVPGRQLFGLFAVLDFCLVAELLNQGLNTSYIESVFESRRDDIDTEAGVFSRYDSPWHVFLQDREKYERKGFYLVSKEIRRARGEFVEYLVGDADEVEGIVWRETERSILNMRSALLINLLKIIHDVEEKTGETLE